MNAAYSVLMVCRANIGRSPLAMGLLQVHVAEETDAWKIASAGTWADEGEPAAPSTQRLLLGKGIDLSTHRSRVVTAAMLAEFNLVLVMEQGQKEALRIEFPEAAKKVFLLSEMSGGRYNIPDPAGKGYDEYESLAKEMEEIFKKGIVKIRQLAGGSQP